MNLCKIFVSIFFTILLVCVTSLITCLILQQESQSIRDRGNRAFHAGVPANANPYIRHGNYYANQWLDAWMDAQVASARSKQ